MRRNRLTESVLTRIVRRVIKEQDEDDYNFDSPSNQYYGDFLDLQDRYENSECDELENVLRDLNNLVNEIDKSNDLEEWEKNDTINKLYDLSEEIEQTIHFDCNGGGYEDDDFYHGGEGDGGRW
jgi:hypothetical protein